MKLKSVKKNVNKSDNISREIEVRQNNVNKSDNFSREIEVCQNNVNTSDNAKLRQKGKNDPNFVCHIFVLL